MVNITINDINIDVEDGTTILEASKIIGMPVPTICYMKGINEIGACRICVVEIEGIDDLVAACTTVCQDGMVIYTNTTRVKGARKSNLELMMSQHRVNCPSCYRNGTCQLQKVVSSFQMRDRLNYDVEYPAAKWPQDAVIQRDESKCIKCYRCVSECEKVQSLNIWDKVGMGTYSTVGVSKGREFDEADCAYCGQCLTHCPTNAINCKSDDLNIFGHKGVFLDPNKVVIAQTAPAVRVAWGEPFGLTPEVANEKRLVSALRMIGFDYVFDTDFAADLTIMEEGTELLHRLSSGKDYKYPMFTSCCPGWVRFLKSQYPDMTDCLSTSKSPHQMLGAIIKTYFAQKLNKNPEDIIVVSVMPCTAKKGEINIPSINDAKEGVKDVDFVLTTRDVVQMIRSNQIDVSMLPESEYDSPLGESTGASVIFGATGGVMEAALRTAYYILTGEKADADETFKAVRATGSDEPWTIAEYNVAGKKITAAVVSGLGNARALIRQIRRGYLKLDFVEVMACPGGCVGGGGQPIHFNEEWGPKRAEWIYKNDKDKPLRNSFENKDLMKLYEEFLGEPCGEKAEKLLHTDHFAWEMPQAPVYDEDVVK